MRPVSREVRVVVILVATITMVGWRTTASLHMQGRYLPEAEAVWNTEIATTFAPGALRKRPDSISSDSQQTSQLQVASPTYSRALTRLLRWAALFERPNSYRT